MHPILQSFTTLDHVEGWLIADSHPDHLDANHRDGAAILHRWTQLIYPMLRPPQKFTLTHRYRPHQTQDGAYFPRAYLVTLSTFDKDGKLINENMVAVVDDTYQITQILQSLSDH